MKYSLVLLDTVIMTHDSLSFIPNIDNGASFIDIPNYDNEIKVDLLLNFPPIIDAKFAQKCLQNKCIVLIGDSSLTETTLDFVMLLAGLSLTKSEVFDFVKRLVTH